MSALYFRIQFNISLFLLLCITKIKIKQLSSISRNADLGFKSVEWFYIQQSMCLHPLDIYYGEKKTWSRDKGTDFLVLSQHFCVALYKSDCYEEHFGIPASPAERVLLRAWSLCTSTLIFTYLSFVVDVVITISYWSTRGMRAWDIFIS